MAKLPLYNHQKEALTPVEGSERIFGERLRKHAIASVVRLQRNKARAGTHSAKSRSYISRSGKKPFAQKGTGQARRGDSRAAGLVGAGVAFPPHPRDYSFALPKKMRKGALRSILSEKLREERIYVLKEHGLKEIKTKDAEALLHRLGVKKALVITPAKDDILEKSMRNLAGHKVLRVEGVNAYDLLYYDEVVILKDALPLLEERLQ